MLLSRRLTGERRKFFARKKQPSIIVERCFLRAKKERPRGLSLLALPPCQIEGEAARGAGVKPYLMLAIAESVHAASIRRGIVKPRPVDSTGFRTSSPAAGVVVSYLHSVPP